MSPALVKVLLLYNAFLITLCNASNATSASDLTSTAEPSTTEASNGPIPQPTGPWLSPEYKWFFQYPLPIPPQKQLKLTYHPGSASSAVIDYYEIEVEKCQKQIYPDRAPTEYVGYDGQVPGPKFVMQRGREAVVRFTNNGPFNISTHVHGQYNRAPFDGWAADYAAPGQYKDYYYPNSQNARSIWYHDHTEYTTGEHAYRGLAGGYIITDPQEQSLGLPKDVHDIALALSAKRYNEDASLNYDTNNSVGVWGDVIQVNEQPWPYLNVEPRKYRLRLLNGAVSRTFDVSLAIDHGSRPGTGKDIQFNVIASDGGLLSHPVQTNHLGLSMGERYEIIVDFAGHAGQNITMRNARGLGENIDYAATDLVMRFCVGGAVSDNTNNGELPAQLRSIPPPPNIDQPAKNFTFERIDGEWLINGVGFADIEHRVLAKPKRGTDELWVLKNGNGNGTHPVHIHLVDFQVLSRTGGRNTVFPWEAAGMKDVVWLGGGETVTVVARYAPWDGVYMFHCHNLVHEDHDMLAVFNVTQLAKWGYDNSTIFIDPMQPEFRPKNIDPADYEVDAIMRKLAWFYSTDAYNHGNAGGVSSALAAYSGEIFSKSSTLKTLPGSAASSSGVTSAVESSSDALTTSSKPTMVESSSSAASTQEPGYGNEPNATSTI